MTHRTELCRLIKHIDANVFGKLHGGITLRFMEDSGYLACLKYLNTNNCEIKQPTLYRLINGIYYSFGSVGEYFSAVAEIYNNSNYELFVKVKVFVLKNNDEKHKISEADLCYVNLNIQLDQKLFYFCDLHPTLNKFNHQNDNGIEPYHSVDKYDYNSIQSYILKILPGIKNNNTNFIPSFPTQIFAEKNDLNPSGIVSGGFLLEQMDVIGAITAVRFCKTPVATVGIDSVDFFEPLFLADICIVCPWVVFTSSRSIEVKINIFRDDIFKKNSNLVCRALYTYVALDENKKAIPVPQFIPNTDDEIDLFQQRLEAFNQKKINRK